MKKIRIVVAGGREFNDTKVGFEKLDFLTRDLDKSEIEVVCGLAKGADTVGKLWAEKNGYPVAKFPANWDKYGKSAGYKRNKEMAEHSTHLIAFWDGKSRGTKYMIDLGKQMKLKIRIVHYHQEEMAIVKKM